MYQVLNIIFIVWEEILKGTKEMYFKAVDLTKSIIDILSYGLNADIAIALVTIQAGLMILYFTFLPMIVENKSKESYLGFKISDWLLFRKPRKKWNDINKNWVINTCFIILEILCIQYEMYLPVLIIFVFFMIILSIKIINYTSFVTNPDMFDAQIEKYFCKNVNSKKDEIIEKIETNCIEDTKSFTKTINYLLKNINDNKDIREIFNCIYYKVIESSNSNNIYKIYELIAEHIKTLDMKNEKLNLIILDYEWYKFVKSSITEVNENKLFNMFVYIYENNLKQYDIEKRNYTDFLINTQKAIEDADITKTTKDRWFSRIFNLIALKTEFIDIELNSYNIYRYIDVAEFMKYIIDSKDTSKLNKLYELIDSKSNHQIDILPIMISIYIYLIYLTRFENTEYITDDERQYYNQVLEKVNECINLQELRIYNNLSTEKICKIFSIISRFYLSWERMKHYAVIKNIAIEASYNILYKIFVIYSKMRFFDEIEETVYDKELDMFRQMISDNKFSKNYEECILEISSKINIPITENTLDKYAKNISEYANKKYKEEFKIDVDEYNSQIERVEELEEISDEMLKKAEIFNNDDFETRNRIKFKYNQFIHKSELKDTLDYLLKEPEEMKSNLEMKIYNTISKKMENQETYTFKGENLLKKLQEFADNKEEYIYLTDKDDNYGKDYMLGQEYLDLLDKYNVINTSVKDCRIIINKLETKYSGIHIDLAELSEVQIRNEMKKYEVSKDRYLYKDNNFGYEIEFNRKEMKQYIDKYYINLSAEYSVEIGDYTNINGCILTYDNTLNS